MVKYASELHTGLETVESLHNGTSIKIKWYKAYPNNINNKIGYHIYYSTDNRYVFNEGVKFVVTDNITEITINAFDPGQLYFFSVRPVEYDPNIFDMATELPEIDGVKFYPSSLLSTNLTSTSLLIPLEDVSNFPNSGIIKIGSEFIQYLSVDTLNNNLVLTNINQRGYNNTFARSHTVDGYDGYRYWDPEVKLITLGESARFDKIYMIEADFEYPNFTYTQEDGYKQVLKDILNSDLNYSDVDTENLPGFDYSGWNRIDPVIMLNGGCVGSYFGGEKGCIDEYGNYNITRGHGVQEIVNERLEVLLSLTGRPAVLLKRQQTGIICACFSNKREYQDDRCDLCFGSKFVMGYQQFYNSKRSDGRILVRVSPTSEKLIMHEAGQESTFDVEMWALSFPVIKPKDVIVIYNGPNVVNDNFSIDQEDFRYEVTEVTRNNLLSTDMGAQKFRAVRVRKTDVIYQIRVFSNTAMFPESLSTTISSSANGNIISHSHNIVINENITNINQINQETSLEKGHSHTIINGMVQYTLGHTHSIILI